MVQKKELFGKKVQKRSAQPEEKEEVLSPSP
jgi:hypothetical protein